MEQMLDWHAQTLMALLMAELAEHTFRRLFSPNDMLRRGTYGSTSFVRLRAELLQFLF